MLVTENVTKLLLSALNVLRRLHNVTLSF